MKVRVDPERPRGRTGNRSSKSGSYENWCRLNRSADTRAVYRDPRKSYTSFRVKAGRQK